MLLLLQTISAVLIVAADRLSKIWAEKCLEPIGEIIIWKGVFNLRFVRNPGAAFSILQGKTVFLIIVPIIACVAMIALLVSRRLKSKLATWGITLILAGAVGNLIDRIAYGSVTDMFDFSLISFPVFNIADIAVTVGAVLFFVYILFFHEDKKQKKAKEKDE